MAKEIERRTSVIGIFHNQQAVIRLVGALMLEQNDESAVSRPFMPVEKLSPCVQRRQRGGNDRRQVNERHQP